MKGRFGHRAQRPDDGVHGAVRLPHSDVLESIACGNEEVVRSAIHAAMLSVNRSRCPRKASGLIDGDLEPQFGHRGEGSMRQRGIA